MGFHAARPGPRKCYSRVVAIFETVSADLADETLVQRVCAGEVALFEQLMRRYNRRLHRIARNIVGEADAEDVLQQAYLDAYAHLAQFEGLAKFSTWLTRIVVHRATTHRRRWSRAVGTPLDDDFSSFAPPPDVSASRGRMMRSLEKAIASLPEPYRLVVILRDVEELSTREAADALGVREEALKVRLHRARTLLRARLGADVTDGMKDVFAFDGARCDRIVAAVLAQLAPFVAPYAMPAGRPLGLAGLGAG